MICRDKNYNMILHKLFRKAELSYAVSDLSKAIGPIIDLMFISQFIGAAGVTVIGYISPLLMLLGFISKTIANGSRNKVSSLLEAGKIDEANSVFSASVALSAGISIIVSAVIGIFCSEVSIILGAKEPQIFEMTKLYILGYLVGVPFYAIMRALTPYLQMDGQYVPYVILKSQPILHNVFHTDGRQYTRRKATHSALWCRDML